MAFVAPTVSDFKERFPEFSAVPNGVVGAILNDEAIPFVDERWLERDRRPAIMYYTAHMLVLQGYPGTVGDDGVAVPGAGGNAQAIKRRKVGDVEVEFQNEWERLGTGNGGLDRTGYSMTSYGRQFLNYLRRNFAPTIAVV